MCGIIFGMKWLSKYDVVIDYFSKTVIFKKLGDLKFILSRRKEGMVTLYDFDKDK